jgi:cation transport regulator ChaC
VPVDVVPPTGPAPAQGPGPLPGPPAKPITPPVVVTPVKTTPKTTPQGSVCIQVPPANEHVQSGMKVSVYLKCQAALGSTIVTGKLALKVDGQTTTVAFRIRPRKTTAIRLTLPKRARTAAASKKHPTLHATLKISTNQVRGAARITQGKLTIQTAPPPIIYVAGQGRPTSVKVTHGKIVVTLVCKANRGRSARGKVCAGTLTLTISGQRMSHSFRMRSGKGLQLTLTLPRSVQTAVAQASHHRLSGTLTIVTRLSRSHTYTARGKLTVSK